MSVSRHIGYRTAERGTPLHRAAPTGGALQRGRGCTGGPVLLATLIIAPLVAATALPASEIGALPSGKPVALLEYIVDEDGIGPVLRARYHAEWLAGHDDIDALFSDMAHLCETDALVARDALSPETGRIIVSLSGGAVDFGEIAPDVPQYFEVYTVQDGRCIWELY